MTGPTDPTYWNTAKIKEIILRGDPVADAAVNAYIEDVAEMPQMEAAGRLAGSIARTATLPSEDQVPELQAFLDDRPPLPDWADREQIARAQELFGQIGPVLGFAMLCNSFPASYASPRGSRILTFSGRLSEKPKRRIMETTQLVWDMFQPGGLEIGAPGWNDARRVRLMHATVRALVTAHADEPHHVDGEPLWLPEWGAPINQMEMTAFIMPMTLTLFDTMPKFGLQLDRQQEEDLLHIWCVVGHLMGCSDDLPPFSIESARTFWDLVQKEEYEYDKNENPDGVELMQAHNEMLDELTPRFLRGLSSTAQRLTLDPKLCDALGIGPPNWTRVPFVAVREITERVWWTQRHDRSIAWAADKVGRTAINRILTMERGGERPPFSVPSELQEMWANQQLQTRRGRVMQRGRTGVATAAERTRMRYASMKSWITAKARSGASRKTP